MRPRLHRALWDCEIIGAAGRTAVAENGLDALVVQRNPRIAQLSLVEFIEGRSKPPLDVLKIGPTTAGTRCRPAVRTGLDMSMSWGQSSVFAENFFRM